MPTYPVTAIGAIPIQVSAATTALATGLLVTADPTNTKPVFVGNGATVTPGTDALSGIPVMPGGAVLIPAGYFCTTGSGTALLANAYCVAASGSNTVYATPDGPAPGASGVAASGGVIGSLSAGSAIIGKVGTDQTTHGTTDLVAADITKVAGAAISQGHGTAALAIRVELPTDGTGVVGLAAGVATIGAVTNAPLTNFGAGNYETVAASQTGQVLGGSGAVGDYISGLLVIPATVNPGNVILLDNAISITAFTGGTASVSNLVPFFIPLGMISVSGAWKVTTGANVSVIGVGKFT